MSRFLLALRCFFAVLFYYRLPRDAERLLPPPGLAPTPKGTPQEGAAAAPAAQPERAPAPAPVSAAPVVVPGAPAVVVEAGASPVVGLVVPAGAPAQAQAPGPTPETAAPAEPAQAEDALRRRGAVQMLALLQREGRLIDFLMEEVDSYGDAQIGAAARDIHRGCRKGLLEHVKVAPIRPEPDEAAVRIDEGYDPSAVRLIGNITGRPPFHGTLRHHGWRAKDVLLPDLPRSHDPQVITPAEVELGG